MKKDFPALQPKCPLGSLLVVKSRIGTNGLDIPSLQDSPTTVLALSSPKIDDHAKEQSDHLRTAVIAVCVLSVSSAGAARTSVG